MYRVTREQLNVTARQLIHGLQFDRRIRWFAYIDRQWMPMTQLYRTAVGLDHCNTYRAWGALACCGVKIRRVGRNKARRLQLILIGQRR